MNVARIGFTPLKGCHHEPQESVELGARGPVDDRLFCLVDLREGRVLRTVRNPRLLLTRAEWSGGVLAVRLPDGRSVRGRPTPTGVSHTVDYWGRPVRIEVVEGPWAEPFSELLGQEVQLARPHVHGDIVYGDAVTLVTTSSIDDLADRLGHEVDRARFRATFVVDTPSADPYGEDRWIGRELAVGSARLHVRGAVSRCALIDRHPDTGERDRQVLAALTRYRLEGTEVRFGVQATVTVPGEVRLGDGVLPGPAG